MTSFQNSDQRGTRGFLLLTQVALVVAGSLLARHAVGQDYGWCLAPAPVAAAPETPTNPQCGKDDPERSCKKCTGSPCLLGSGAYFASGRDLQLPSAGPNLSVDRYYESGRPVDGALGLGWRSNLSSRVHYATFATSASTSESLAIATLPDGSSYTFVERLDGSFAPAHEGADILERQTDGSFLLTVHPSKTRYAFDTGGRLASITDDSGRSLSYHYDLTGRVERVTDDSGAGRYIEVFYGADGRISTVRDPSGRQASYTYGAADGTLRTITDVAGRVTHLDYGPGRYGPVLTRITDHWGRVVTDVTYDTIGRVKTYTDGGETYTYTYLYGGNLSSISKTDSNGNRWSYGVGPTGLVTRRTNPSSQETRTTYDTAGRVSEVIDPRGVHTNYGYGPEGQVASVTTSNTGADEVRFEYSYDPAFPNKVSTVVPKNPSNGATLTKRQAWRYEYWAAGSPSPGALKTVKRVRSDGAQETVATYQYDAQGRVTHQISGSGAQTDYVYDGSGNLESVTGPANNEAAARPQTTYGYDSLGRVTSVTDPLGRVTGYTYDGLGRVLTATLPKPSAGSPLVFTTTYSYDNWDAGTGLLYTYITDPNGRVTKLGYDQYGRLVKSIDAATNATTYGYARGLLESITDANGNVTRYLYDGQQRLRTTTFPDGATESYTYWEDGQLATKTDRRGTTVSYNYDGYKRLRSKYFSTGGSVTYTYEGQLLTQVVDSTVTPSESHLFTYDSSYRLETATQGSRGMVGYTYGPDDRVEVLDLPGGVSADYAYYPDGSLKTIDWSPVAGAFRWDYTATGQYQQVAFPNGQTRSYGYDDQGRLVQLSNALGATTLANVVYGYDVDYATGTSTMLGQRTGQTMTAAALDLSGALTKYQYDALYQLRKAEYPPAAPFNGVAESWTYDAIGNRLTATAGASTRALTYFKNGANPQNGQRLQSDGDAAWGYDAAGNATSRQGSDGSFAFGYDQENRMTAVSGAAIASYTYDYQGRRTSKTVGGLTTTYLYDGLNLVSETTGGQTTYFLNGPGIDEPLAMSKGGAMKYFSVDGLGSVVATNDSSGAVTHSVAFDAWGNVKAETGTRTHPFTYTGRETGEAGFHFYRARFYQPGIGRFIQEDPISSPGARMSFGLRIWSRTTTGAPPRLAGLLNPRLDAEASLDGLTSRYSYVMNQGTIATDPEGALPDWVGKAFGAIGRTIGRALGFPPGAGRGYNPVKTVPIVKDYGPCFILARECLDQGSRCRNEQMCFLKTLDEEREYELYATHAVSGQAAYLKKVCFEEVWPCKEMMKSCPKAAANPFGPYKVAPDGYDIPLY